jgi:acetolactate synthase-1/2/3 large subunit
MKASDLFVKALENEGVEYIFGIPGEENLDLLESLRTSSIKLVLTRHEQAAGFMAATYGRLTGKPGVCLSTLGPGATNLVTAAAYAQLGAMPLVMITGQKPIKTSKQGQFQIVDVVETFRPMTKSARRIVDPTRIPSLVREAFRLASEERPGAVHLELPEDIAREEVDRPLFKVIKSLRPAADPESIKQAVAMIQKAKSPLLLIGAGANRKRTSAALRAFVKKTGIPFFSTQMGAGVLDADDPLSLGAAALSDKEYVHCAIDRADLIISVGHDVVEKPPFVMEEDKQVIHVNFFSAQIDDVYFPHHEVLGDIATSISELTKAIAPQPSWDFAYFLTVRKHKARQLSAYSASSVWPLIPQKVVADVRAAMPSDGIVCLDNGMYKLWFSRNYPARQPNTLLLDNALATMGAGLPSAMAAHLVNPNVKVMAVCGDGGFMMNSQELETAVRLKMNLVVLILNDSGYGMIKWKQDAMQLQSFGLDFGNPDFVAYANAYGAHGHRVGKADELLPMLKKCMNEPGVHLIDVPLEYSQNERLTLDVASLHAEIEAEEKRLAAAATGTATATAEPTHPTTPAPQFAQVKSPFDRSDLSSVAMADAAQVEAALAKARALFDNRDGWLPPHKRIAILERLAVLMEEHKQELIDTAVSEGGKPYVDTVVEVDRAIQGVKLGIQAIHQLHGEQVPMGLTAASTNRLATTFVEPIGVVVSLSAFNHPLNLAVHQIVPAIAAGCPVIFKPAANTPMSGFRLAELLTEAGLPDGWCQALLCSNELGEKLVTDKRVAYLSFIGSARVGWYLRSRLAPGTRCALEHGGVAPVIIDASADMAEVVPSIVKGGFYHAGQVCVSVQRVYVPTASLDAFSTALAAKASALKVGDPRLKETDVGPLIRPGEVDRVAEWVDEAVKAGAKLACGGKKLSDTCYAPTVLVNPPANVRISTEEVFGPVVCVYSYDDVDEAISRANSTAYAFQAAVFSKDLDRAMYAVQRLNATAVMVNDHTAFRVDWMPFGGRDASGIGMGGISHSATEMSRIKLMVLKSAKLA